MERPPFKYQALFDSNMIGVAATDFNDTILDANATFLNIVGYTTEDLANGTLRWSTISPQKYNEADELKIIELLKQRSIIPFEKEYIHKSGRIVPVLVGAEALDDTLSYGVCFAIDISNLKEGERKKEDFAAFVSHELRTPLSILKLSADLLSALILQNGQKDEQLEVTEQINGQIDKLTVMVTDLLNMSRYQGDTSSITMNAIDMYDTLLKTAQELSSIYNRNILFEGEENLFIHGNTDLLGQVVINFINNAVRYSPPEADINIKLWKNGSHVCISVQDFGIGISEENKAKIFDRFYRINHADEYSQEGAGVGLYICNEIVKQHGGTIEVESSEGKGSTFTIFLSPIV